MRFYVVPMLFLARFNWFERLHLGCKNGPLLHLSESLPEERRASPDARHEARAGFLLARYLHGDG